MPVALSLLLLLPCLLPERIQAGDLSSHLYNTWLAQLIRAGQAPGLWLATQRTNVLFDLMLDGLWQAFGPRAAEKIAVSIAVLVFFWGAYALACSLGRRRPVFLLPCLAMLTYGWFFHSGFFNFYLSMGMSFWLLVLMLRPTRLRLLAAVPLAALAATGHALPPAVAAGLAGYAWMGGRLAPHRRPALLAASLLALFALGRILSATLTTIWYPNQLMLFSGTDQVVVYGGKYFLLQLMLLALWAGLLVRAVGLRGRARTFWDIRMHLVVLCAWAAVALPSAILFTGYSQGLLFVAERLSFWVAVLLCGWLGIAPLRGAERALPAVLAGLFFLFLGLDVAAVNRFEDRLSQALRAVPEGGRVVNGVTGDSPAINPLTHVIDRACIGRCYSFANYEPSTRQFRVRCGRGNTIVAGSYPDAFALQAGGYVVKATDPALYVVFQSDGGYSTRLLRPGETLHVTPVPIPPKFF